MNPQVFREYDIRGVVEDDFDDEFVVDLGRAYATMLQAGRQAHDHARPRLPAVLGPPLRSAARRPAAQRHQRGRYRRGADAAALFFGAALEDGRRRDDHRQPQRRRVQRLQARRRTVDHFRRRDPGGPPDHRARGFHAAGATRHAQRAPGDCPTTAISSGATSAAGPGSRSRSTAATDAAAWSRRR